jgi:E3 ubiquitin-protein ligase synoviolin
LQGSTALALGVVSWAFYSRPNFYSAAVYLSHSNFCLLVSGLSQLATTFANLAQVLCNLALLSFISVLWFLQRVFFGPLRQIEIEQLYERGWITGTEWLFAISIFRDEFSLWCLSMFVVLFFSKIWGWIAEGRIEALEQQQPANRRLYHARLVASLAVYMAFSAAITKFCLDEVIYEARPGVMIMFLFEFMIITIGAVSTSAKYALWAYEHRLLSKQHEERVAQLRREAVAEGRDPSDINEADMDIHDLDLPGWEAKGTWQFGVDICSGTYCDVEF